jgi:hypothetical protein
LSSTRLFADIGVVRLKAIGEAENMCDWQAEWVPRTRQTDDREIAVEMD